LHKKSKSKNDCLGKFEKAHPFVYKIKEYFKRPSKMVVQIEGLKQKPNFYIDFLGYKQTLIKLTKEEINDAYRKALTKTL
jgi:hypothetical protein